MGSNMAEAHPVGFQWVMEAKARGARLIHVDPRFTRTSAVAHQHVTLRAGGIYALRGHASIQGSTDIPTLFNLLPGYLPMPDTRHENLASYLRNIRGDKQKGFWRDADRFVISLLKEYWGDAATPENDFCFDYLPRISGDHGTYRTVMDMVDGKVSGYFLLGQNPAVGSAHGRLQRLGLANLDWLVVRDLTMIESATFWTDAPEVETGEIVTERCRTEVFFMPAASHVEKAGTFTQTQRMLQWRDQAVEPAGDQRSELWFFYHLGRRLKEKLAGSTDERDHPLLDLAWDYQVEGDEPSSADVLRHINGIDLRTGRAVDGYLDLRADGSTSCGCWIYSGVYAGEVNQARRRKSWLELGLRAPGQPVQPGAAGSARRGVPLRVHRRPAHRAPHRRRHEPAAPVPVGAAAGAVRGGVAGTRGRARPAPSGLGSRHHQPHRGGRPGGGHRPDGAAAGGRPGGAPAVDAVPLGPGRADHR